MEERPYPFVEFPKWKYHFSKPACMVNDPHEEAALGEGWVDSPAYVKAPEPPAAEPEPVVFEAPATPKKKSKRS